MDKSPLKWVWLIKGKTENEVIVEQDQTLSIKYCSRKAKKAAGD
jgi:hypothetical protein